MGEDRQLQAVIGRALVDREFRTRLVGDVRGTLDAEGFRLDPAMVDAIECATRDPDRIRSFSARFEGEFLARAEYAV
jgi:hypothetical protein